MLRRRASSEAAPRGARSRTHKSRQSDTRMFISKREDKRLSQPPLLRPLFLVTKHFGEDEEGEQRSLDIVRERGTLDKASSGSVDLAIDTYDAQVDRLRALHVPLATFVTIRGPGEIDTGQHAILEAVDLHQALTLRRATRALGRNEVNIRVAFVAYTGHSRPSRFFHDPRSAYSLASSYACDSFSTSHARIVKAVPGRVRGKPIYTERSISRTASHTTDSSYICIAYEADSDPHEAVSDPDAALSNPDEAASNPTCARVGIEDTEGSACYTEDACPSSSIASGPGCCPIACAEAAAMECEYGGAGVADEGDWGSA
ncbi:hypothetical protein FB107DRAFT_278737 [Schizophyllum commune]